MKIKKVILPKIADYYISDNCKENIKKRINGGMVEILDGNLNVICDNDYCVHDALKMIQSKSEKVTIGDQRKYEYEMDTSIPCGHIFEFVLDDQDTSVLGSLVSVTNLPSSDLHLIFSIVNK